MTATEGLVSSGNPLAPFAEEIVRFRIGPTLLDIIQTWEKEGTPIQSKAELLKAYNEVVRCNLSMQTFNKWCKFLNIGIKTSFTMDVKTTKQPEYIQQIPLPPEEPPSGEAFDNEKIIGAGVSPIDNSVVIPRDGSGLHELAAMMAGTKND